MRNSAAAAFDFREAEAKLRWRQRGSEASHQDRGRHRTERDRFSGDQDRGERPQPIPLAEHGIWGRPHQGAERHLESARNVTQTQGAV